MEKKQKTKVIVVKRDMTLTITERLCPTCGKTFEGFGKKKFCSKRCSNKAAWNRHADEYKATRREKYHVEKQAMKPKRKAGGAAAHTRD